MAKYATILVNPDIIRLRMIEKELMQSELAEKAGVSVAGMSRVMRGKATTVKTVRAIARALGTRVPEIILRPESGEQPDRATASQADPPRQQRAAV